MHQVSKDMRLNKCPSATLAWQGVCYIIMPLGMPWQPPCVSGREPQRNAAPFFFVLVVALLQADRCRGRRGITHAAGIVAAHPGTIFAPSPSWASQAHRFVLHKVCDML